LVSKITISLISTVTVGSGGAASIEFTGIPQTGQDLYLVSSIRTNNNGVESGVLCRFNGDTNTANYSLKRLYGTGSTVATGSDANFYAGHASGNTSTTSTFGNSSLYLPNYSSPPLGDKSHNYRSRIIF